MSEDCDDRCEPDEDRADRLALEDQGETVGQQREGRRDGETGKGARARGEAEGGQDEQRDDHAADGVPHLGEHGRGGRPGAGDLDRRTAEHRGADEARGDLNTDRGAGGAAEGGGCR